MAVGRLRLRKKSGSAQQGNALIYTTATLNSAGIPSLSGTVGGQVGTDPDYAFKSGATAPLIGVVSYGTPTSATSLSKVRTIRIGVLFYVVVGLVRNSVPTKFFAAVNPTYWDVQQNQGTPTNPDWVTIPYRNRAVRVAPSITASGTELRSGRSITYPPTPISPPPTPPVTPEPEEEDEEEEEEEEEETPTTPTPTGIQGVINTFLQQVLTAIRTAVTNSVQTITTTIPTSFGTTVTALTTAVKGIGDAVEEFATDAADTVRTGVQTANAGLITALNTGRSALQNAISLAIQGVTNALNNGLSAVRTSLTTALNGIKTSANNAVNRLQTAIVNAMGRLRQTMSSAWSTIAGRLSSIATGITSTLSDRLGDMVSVILGLRQRLQTGLESIVRSIRETMAAITQKVGELAIDLLGDIYRSGNSLWGWIVSLLSDSRVLIGAVAKDMLPGLSSDEKALIRKGPTPGNHDLSLIAIPPPELP